MKIEFLIDPEGRQISMSVAMADWRGYSGRSSGELRDYLVRNSGYIYCVSGRLHLSIWFRTDTLALTAGTTLLYLLADETANERRMVSICSDEKVTETFRTPEAAFARLEALVEQNSTGRHSRFARRRIRSDSLEMPEQFGHLIEAWKGGRNPKTDPTLRRWLHEVLHGRFLTASCHRSSGRVILTGAGSGHISLDEQWRSRAVGRLFGDMHDRIYLGFVLQAYREAAQVTEPVVEQIEALIVPRDRGAFRVSYQRILLPTLNDDRSAVGLLCASLIQRHSTV